MRIQAENRDSRRLSRSEIILQPVDLGILLGEVFGEVLGVELAAGVLEDGGRLLEVAEAVDVLTQPGGDGGDVALGDAGA